MRVLSVFLAGLVLVGAATGASAGDSVTAAETTESGRRLDRALDIVLDASRRVATGPRTLCVVIDPTPSLVTAGFADGFEAALTRAAAVLGTTEIAVLRAGEKDPVVLAPTSDRAAVAKAVRAATTNGKNSVRNVYVDARAGVSLLSGRAGAREMLLVTLENGDVEDDLEATVSALHRAKVRTYVVTREALLSDAYALSRGTKAPRDAEWTGGDAAFHEIPWGWVFQNTNGNESAASGFAAYGLTRLATGTEGRLFLISSETSAAHSCSTYGGCAICSGDHVPRGEAYQPTRLRALAPLSDDRDAVLAAAAKDPYYRAVHAAWKQASDAGLVRSRPSIDLAGGTAKLERRTTGSVVALTGNGLAFTSMAARAGKALEACDTIRKELEADLARIKPEDGSARWRAVAEYVRLMLHLTRVNLVHYVGWCQEVGPAVTSKKPAEGEPAWPEVPWFAEGIRITGVSYTDWSLCHGVKPYREMFLPGGAALRDALSDLDDVYGAYMSRYEGTPFAVAAHRSSLARFLFTVQGKTQPPPPKKSGGSTADDPSTTPTDRPARDGGGGTQTGPTTSGG